MILHCTCKHEWQDQRYGRGLRVHNQKKNLDWRCTVCGNVQSPSRTSSPGPKVTEPE